MTPLKFEDIPARTRWMIWFRMTFALAGMAFCIYVLIVVAYIIRYLVTH